MFESLPLRQAVTSVVVILSATTLAACGDSSDDASKASASADAKATKVVATTAAPSNGAPSTTAPSAPQPEVPDPARTAQGTGLLRALRLGTPGRLVVEPKGAVPGPGTEHWYKFGTVVTVHAKDTPTARFSGWAGDVNCNSARRTCKVTIGAPVTVALAGFNLVAKNAKGLKKSDPRLKALGGD